MRIGVAVSATEIPPATGTVFDTANAFMIGSGDWGPVGSTVKCLSINDVTNAIGPRSGTNSVLWDSADVYFREGGGVLFISRVGGASAGANATLALAPSAALTLTAKYPGVYGNQIFVVVQNNTSTYTITLQDVNGNPLAVSPALSTLAAGVAWAATTNLVTATSSGSTLPSTATATAMAGGTNGTTPTLTQYQAALTAIPAALGPGQVSAPGVTNTTISGIWSALGTHAASNVNRVAICDMDDQQSAATLIADLASFGTSVVASYCGFWAGQVIVPGNTNASGVTRTVPASAVISALCARADALGNPNLAAAGDDFQLDYVQSFTGTNGAPLYGQSDIDTLNAAGINTWNNVFGVLQNYGFVTPVLSTTDTIYWQFNHSRLRMALEADAQVIGQPFVFSQISQLDIAAFASDLAADLAGYVTSGAISTIAPGGTTDQGFAVDTGSTVNTPATMAAGLLLANVSFRPAPFAQLVEIQLNAVPVTAAIA